MGYHLSKLLVCLDVDSELNNAFDFAVSFARQSDCEIVVVNVLSNLTTHTSNVIEKLFTNDSDTRELLVDGCIDKKLLMISSISSHDLSITRQHGFFTLDPAGDIVRYSEDLAADMIIFERNKKSVESYCDDSIFHRVLGQAKVPVLCVP